LAKRRLDLGDDENTDGQAGANTNSTSKQPMIVDGSILKTDLLGIEKEMNVNVQRRTEQTPSLGSAASREESDRSQ
jgi:hypothetical protein